MPSELGLIIGGISIRGAAAFRLRPSHLCVRSVCADRRVLPGEPDDPTTLRDSVALRSWTKYGVSPVLTPASLATNRSESLWSGSSSVAAKRRCRIYHVRDARPVLLRRERRRILTGGVGRARIRSAFLSVGDGGRAAGGLGVDGHRRVPWARARSAPPLDQRSIRVSQVNTGRGWRNRARLRHRGAI